MENMNDALLETYLFETNSLLEQLDELLIHAEKVGSFTQDEVNEIFRSMHTIKGSSAMLEFQPLMEVAHHIEDLFFFIRENGMDALSDTQKSELFNLMFQSTDRLRSDVEKVENNEPLSMNIDSFVAEINHFLEQLKSGETAVTSENDSTEERSASQTDTSSLPASDAPFTVHVLFDKDCGMENLRAFMLVNSLNDTDIEYTFYPPDVETNPDTCPLVKEKGFLLYFQNKKDAETAISIIDTSSSIRSYELIEKIDEKEDSTTESNSEQAPQVHASDKATEKVTEKGTPSGHTKQSLISVSLSKLDQLMDVVGEIVITESMVLSSPDIQGLKLDNFSKSTRQLRKLTDDLQDIAMSLRMVSVSGVFQKMNRIVRDMKKALGKDVRLTIEGEETEVDKAIVDRIGDPIMHIVRNAMDHGIESNVQDRLDAGKPAQGEIILSASHTGSEVIIKITDDGQGMDTDAILAKASRGGILTKPESEYSKKEILALLMIPGFSTNQEVTEYSGRGVGLDVVKKNVESLSGTIRITSEKGQGSCMTLRIPLTLAIVDGMGITIGDQVFTIPIANIRQCFKASDSQIVLDAEGHEMIRWMDAFYPIVRMNRLFQMNEGFTSIEDGILIWVEAGEQSYCIFVDQLIGEQQVVVKPFPPYLNQFNIKDMGISGCTILGDGNISLILDIGSLYTAAKEQF